MYVMWKLLGSVAVAACMIGAAQADDAVKEAQQLLTSLGYEAGPVDGAIGKKTLSAIETFMLSKGTAFDGKIDATELAALQEAAAELVPTLNHPGRLIDDTHAKTTSCNALAPSRVQEAGSAYDALEPIAKLNDSISVGGSPLWDSIDPWLKVVLTEAALFDATGNPEAGEHALSQLEKWAAADAVLKTPVDNTYSGGGNRGNYRPSASAPVLDMENAAQLGYAVYYAVAMLDGLDAARLAEVRAWADRITDRFGGPIGDSVFARSQSGLWRLEARPLLVRAILDGDAKSYRELIEAYYAKIRKVVSDTGAILKNANRGDRALHYQSQGLLSFAAILDLVEQQGGKIPPDIEAKFHKAVTFMLDADRDVNVILPLAREGYNNAGDPAKPLRFYRESGEHYWWMYYYISKYPDTDNAARLRHLLDLYDTYEDANTSILATTWVPYPINCYRPFDMSEQAVADAAALVNAKYPAIEEQIAPTVIETGIGGVTSDSLFEARSVRISESFRERNFVEYQVQVNGPKLDGKLTFMPTISIFTDFNGSADDAENLQLFRLVFYKRDLLAPASREASYLDCGELSASMDNGNEMLKLHVGHGAEKNECLLSKMDEKDRTLWSSVLVHFGDVLEVSRESDAATRVRELYARVK